MVITHKYAMIDAGTPLEINSFTVKYGLPNSSLILIAVTLGNPEVGNAIAQEAIKAVPKINKFGCGFGKESPTSLTNGTIINAATVWDTNVANTRTMIPKISKIT